MSVKKREAYSMPGEADPISANQSSAPQQSKKSILLTVGTDLPFDRLVRALDVWVRDKTDFDIFAQIGESKYRPDNMSYSAFLEPSEFATRFQSADLIISHAGMGTILSSLTHQKPLLVMPRIAALGEHRNEHQLATAKYLKELNKVHVAGDENELVKILEEMRELPVLQKIGRYASTSLTKRISDFIAE